MVRSSARLCFRYFAHMIGETQPNGRLWWVWLQLSEFLKASSFLGKWKEFVATAWLRVAEDRIAAATDAAAASNCCPQLEVEQLQPLHSHSCSQSNQRQNHSRIQGSLRQRASARPHTEAKQVIFGHRRKCLVDLGWQFVAIIQAALCFDLVHLSH